MEYQWYRGCSPTASAMVLGYWDTHGYPNFPSGNTLIDELATAMGTGSSWPFNGATWPFWIDNGIETVARNHGYTTFDAIENTWLWGDHFEEMASEIDSVRPFVLSMAGGGAAVGKPTAYGSHSVTGVGYVRGIQNYITIQPDTLAVPSKSILRDGKQTWQATPVRTLQALVSVADFQSTMAAVVRPAQYSPASFVNHRSTSLPNGGFRKTRPSQGWARPSSSRVK